MPSSSQAWRVLINKVASFRWCNPEFALQRYAAVLGRDGKSHEQLQIIRPTGLLKYLVSTRFRYRGRKQRTPNS